MTSEAVGLLGELSALSWRAPVIDGTGTPVEGERATCASNTDWTGGVKYAWLLVWGGAWRPPASAQ